MDVRLTGVQVVGWIVFVLMVFKSLSVIGQCPMNMNILAPKIAAILHGLKQFSQKWF
jgi:hypothetical protein